MPRATRSSAQRSVRDAFAPRKPASAETRAKRAAAEATEAEEAPQCQKRAKSTAAFLLQLSPKRFASGAPPMLPRRSPAAAAAAPTPAGKKGRGEPRDEEGTTAQPQDTPVARPPASKRQVRRALDCEAAAEDVETPAAGAEAGDAGAAGADEAEGDAPLAVHKAAGSEAAPQTQPRKGCLVVPVPEPFESTLAVCCCLGPLSWAATWAVGLAQTLVFWPRLSARPHPRYPNFLPLLSPETALPAVPAPGAVATPSTPCACGIAPPGVHQLSCAHAAAPGSATARWHRPAPAA